MNRLRCVHLFFIFLLPGWLEAQFNDSTFYLLSVSSTGVINKTNEAAAYTLSNALRFSVRKKALVVNSSSRWLYGQQQRELTNNDFNTSIDANWFRPQKKWYYWLLVNYETSLSLNVYNRSQMGLGLAYNFVDQPNFFINLSNGVLYEFAAIKLNAARDVHSTWRNSLRLRLKYVHKQKLTLQSTSFYQSSLQAASDYLLNSNSSISFKLNKWLAFTSMLRYEQVSRNSRENLLLTFGITAEHYF